MEFFIFTFKACVSSLEKKDIVEGDIILSLME